MCELGSVPDGAGAHERLLADIGGQRHTGTTVLESIARTLGDRSVLVIIDNCEHLLAPVLDVCEEILERCPEARLLATSREPLGTRHEIVLPVGELSREAAVELFVAEARRHGAQLDDTDPAIDRICERLPDALDRSKRNLEWFAEKGMWTFAMQEMPRAATAIDRAGRPDMAMVALSALDHSPVGSATGADVDQLRDRISNDHPDQADTWWASGQRIDPPAAVSLIVPTMESLLARERPTDSGQPDQR